MVHHHDLECYLCERFEWCPPQGQGHSDDCWTKTKMNVTVCSMPSELLSFFFFFFCNQTWYRCMCIISSHITPPLPHPPPQTSPPKEKDKTKATTRTTKCSVKLHSLIQNRIQLECTGSALKQWVMLHLFRSILWWLQSPDQWGFYLFVCLFVFWFSFCLFFPLKYCVMTDL